MIWIDALTPKQLLWAAHLSAALKSAGFTAATTTRNYREVNWLVRELRLVDILFVGRYGGGTIEGKLRASLSRCGALLRLLKKFNPALAFSFGSPEAARVSFGLGLPHFMQCDSPHAEAVAKLTVPLSEKLFTPWFIPASAWSRYGISTRDVVKYKALDPFVWLRDVMREPSAPYAGVDPKDITVTVRAEETKAAYLMGKIEKPVLLSWLPEFAAKHPNVKFVIVPRYADQYMLITRELRKARVVNVRTLREPVVGYKLIRASSVFVGYGGTMTAEAVLLGVPALACFPGGLTYTDRFLVTRGLAIRPTDPRNPTEELEAILTNLSEVRERLRAKVKKLVKTFENPNDVIVEAIAERLSRT